MYVYIYIFKNIEDIAHKKLMEHALLPVAWGQMSLKNNASKPKKGDKLKIFRNCPLSPTPFRSFQVE